jgi:hypothetical protein
MPTRYLLAAAALAGCSADHGAGGMPLLRLREKPIGIDLALAQGTPMLTGACVTVGGLSIVWPHDAKVTRDAASRTIIVSAMRNSRAVLGELTDITGGNIATPTIGMQKHGWRDVAETGCRPPYFVTGEFHPTARAITPSTFSP